MGGEGTAGLLSLLIREGGLGRGGASAHILGEEMGRGLLGEAGDTGMGTRQTDLRMGSETQEWS